jgi:hypothetical protein
MAAFGYTMMCEQSRPDRLVGDLCSAERAGFDFSVISDHYAPWLEEQGHRATRGRSSARPPTRPSASAS